MIQVMQSKTIPELLDRVAASFPERKAIVNGSKTIYYPELKSESESFAKGLLAAGIRMGDTIGIWCPNRWEWIVACLGSQLIGAVVVPLNTRMRSAEITGILERAKVRLLVSIGNFLGHYYPDMVRAICSDNIKLVVVDGRDGDESWADFIQRGQAIDDRELADASSLVVKDSVLDLLFTSGTSGQPKGVLTSHEQNLKTFGVWADRAHLEEGDRYLIISPFFHSFGYKAGWMAAFLKGATVYPHQVFDATEILSRIDAEKITVLPGPPTLFTEILGHPDRQRYDLSSLRVSVTGSASVAPALVRAMREELAIDTVLTAYGLTEASGVVSMCEKDDAADLVAHSCGKAIPGCEIEIWNSADERLSTGETGEIMVRGFNVMLGYFDDKEATRATLTDEGWLHTGDVGYLDENGYLYITDRLKEMFIVGGFNCYPAEVERLMLDNDCIREVAVVGVPDERLGEVGKAYVVLKEHGQLDQDTLVAWCRNSMANFKVPRYVEFVESLPRNASGKVVRAELKAAAVGTE